MGKTFPSKRRNDYGKMEKIRFIILESKKKESEEGTIEKMFPCVLAVFKRVMRVYGKEFKLDADSFEILEVKTAKYKDAPIEPETFAKIIARIDGILIESYIGKAVGFRDSRKMEIFFERGAILVDFSSEDPVKTDPPVRKDKSNYPISRLT